MKKMIVPLLAIALICILLIFIVMPRYNLSRERKKVIKINESLYDKTGTIPGHVIAEEAIDAFREFGRRHPKDSIALPYHIKAGDLAFTLGKFSQSAEIFNEILTIYPQNNQMPYVYLRLGALYNDKLNDTVQAKAFYNRILDEFPDDPFVESALFGLETLGLNEDEQLRVILNKNAAAVINDDE